MSQFQIPSNICLSGQSVLFALVEMSGVTRQSGVQITRQPPNITTQVPIIIKITFNITNIQQVSLVFISLFSLGFLKHPNSMCPSDLRGQNTKASISLKKDIICLLLL